MNRENDTEQGASTRTSAISRRFPNRAQVKHAPALAQRSIGYGQEGFKAEIWTHGLKQSQTRDAQAKTRNAEVGALGKEGQEQKAGNCNRPVRSPQEWRQGAVPQKEATLIFRWHRNEPQNASL